MSRRYSSLPLKASVGPFNVPGRVEIGENIAGTSFQSALSVVRCKWPDRLSKLFGGRGSIVTEVEAMNTVASDKTHEPTDDEIKARVHPFGLVATYRVEEILGFVGDF